jgi:ATP phosphoribosyltransferase
MYTIEIILKNNPIALSVQRKEQENAEALYRQIASVIAESNVKVLELTCEKQEGKKVSVITSEITAVQISDKSGTSANLGAGFVRG